MAYTMEDCINKIINIRVGWHWTYLSDNGDFIERLFGSIEKLVNSDERPDESCIPAYGCHISLCYSMLHIITMPAYSCHISSCYSMLHIVTGLCCRLIMQSCFLKKKTIIDEKSALG